MINAKYMQYQNLLNQRLCVNINSGFRYYIFVFSVFHCFYTDSFRLFSVKIFFSLTLHRLIFLFFSSENMVSDHIGDRKVANIAASLVAAAASANGSIDEKERELNEVITGLQILREELIRRVNKIRSFIYYKNVMQFSFQNYPECSISFLIGTICHVIRFVLENKQTMRCPFESESYLKTLFRSRIASISRILYELCASTHGYIAGSYCIQIHSNESKYRFVAIFYFMHYTYSFEYNQNNIKHEYNNMYYL